MIAVNNLKKAYRENVVLRGLSFEVSENCTLAILGESGCGKTTLLRLLAGLEEADGGWIEIGGKKMDASVPPHERNLALVFQEATLWNHMTVYDNMAFGMRQKDEKRLKEIAKKLGVEELLKRYPEEVSGGQAKRIALGRALAADREILLLDEPLSNLDKETGKQVLKYLKSEYCGRKTILYVTHGKEEAEFLDCEVLYL